MTASRLLRPVAGALALALSTSGCFRGGGRLLGAMTWTAIVTAAIVSSHPPPPPMVVVYPPEPRSGYSWQPGYWTVVDDEWVWIEGHWIRNYAGYHWSPAHWIQDPDGHWRLVPGAWLPFEPPPPPPPGY